MRASTVEYINHHQSLLSLIISMIIALNSGARETSNYFLNVFFVTPTSGLIFRTRVRLKHMQTALSETVNSRTYVRTLSTFCVTNPLRIRHHVGWKHFNTLLCVSFSFKHCAHLVVALLSTARVILSISCYHKFAQVSFFAEL